GILATIEFLAPELTAYNKHEFQAAIFSHKEDQFFVQHNGRVFPCYTRTIAITSGRLLDGLRSCPPLERVSSSDRLICAEPVVMLHFSIPCCRSCCRSTTPSR